MDKPLTPPPLMWTNMFFSQTPLPPDLSTWFMNDPEAREIKLIGVYPPIEKMEGPFHLLINCEKFSLSTNCIANISNLQAFKNIKVLSLGRNIIKSLQVCASYWFRNLNAPFYLFFSVFYTLWKKSTFVA